MVLSPLGGTLQTRICLDHPDFSSVDADGHVEVKNAPQAYLNLSHLVSFALVLSKTFESFQRAKLNRSNSNGEHKTHKTRVSRCFLDFSRLYMLYMHVYAVFDIGMDQVEVHYVEGIAMDCFLQCQDMSRLPHLLLFRTQLCNESTRVTRASRI